MTMRISFSIKQEKYAREAKLTVKPVKTWKFERIKVRIWVSFAQSIQALLWYLSPPKLHIFRVALIDSPVSVD